ncbi:MAG: hypothetical protein DME26_21060, partial [Verrucomicrobia bacterium]
MTRNELKKRLCAGSYRRISVLPAKKAILALSLWLGFVTPVPAISRLFAWGDLGQFRVPAGLSDIVVISAGHFHNLVLRADASVVAWASTPDAPAVQMPGGLANVIGIAAGLEFSLALRADRTVVAWGDNSAGQINVPPSLTNVLAIAAGGYHGLALSANGSVRAWGDNGF